MVVKIYGFLVESRLIRIQSKVTQTEKYSIQPKVGHHGKARQEIWRITIFDDQFSDAIFSFWSFILFFCQKVKSLMTHFIA